MTNEQLTILFSSSKYAEVILNRKQLKAYLLDTGGNIRVMDQEYRVKAEPLGAGLFRITLKKRGLLCR